MAPAASWRSEEGPRSRYGGAQRSLHGLSRDFDSTNPDVLKSLCLRQSAIVARAVQLWVIEAYLSSCIRHTGFWLIRT
ncbi:UNVERIFIED_CONTAM: hypothetical protein K2H54_062504 [Gekko kuhli]